MTHDTRLGDPHHDGSAAYVATPGDQVVATPAMGASTTVAVDVPHAAGLTEIHLRTVEDGEPIYHPVRRVHRGRAIDRYEAEVPQVTPTQRYRFQLAGPSRSGWLTQLGFVEYDVPDTWDFALVATPPPPVWAADAVLYQIFPDRFARAGASDDWPDWCEPADWHDQVATTRPSSMRQLFGGDLPGIAAHIDHLLDLGVTGIYLTPFFPSAQNHRYNASSFDGVDPFLGGDEGLAELARSLHARGLRLIGDLTLNHSGSTHEWFVAAQADASAPEAGYYHFIEHPNRYHAWRDVPTLPKFDHRDAELRRRLYEGPQSVAARYLGAPFHLDGWRIDAANMAGRLGGVDRSHALQAALLDTIGAAGGDRYLLAEHCHDATADLQGDGWHGTMDYSGFTRPVWSWLKDPDRDVTLLGPPAPLHRRDAATTAWAMDLVRGQLPWRSVVHGMNLLGSHDTARWAHVAGDRDRRHVGLVWLLTFPGVPSLFYGDELGLGADVDLDGAPDTVTRQPMPWDAPERWDTATLGLVRRLTALRRSSAALRRGGLRWVHLGTDVLVYLRHHPEGRVLVQLCRRACDPVAIDAALLDTTAGRAALDHGDLEVGAGRVVLPGSDHAQARVWHLAPPDVPSTRSGWGDTPAPSRAW